MSWLSRLNIFKSRSSLTTLGLVLVILIPAILALIYIRLYAVNVPYWDQFQVIPLFDKLHNGHLSIFDFIAQHNEHRLFLPRLVMLGLGSITHYNVIAEDYLAWFFLLLTGIVILVAFLKAFGTKQSTLAKFIPVTWLLFTLHQSPTYLWGFQIAFPMTIFFGVLSLYLLATSNSIGWRFGIALLCGVACTLSMSNGLLIWPVGFLQLFCYFRFLKKIMNRSRVTMIAIWGIVGIIVVAMYFMGFTYPDNSPSPFYVLHHIFTSIVSLFACVGSPLASTVSLAAIIGALFLMILIWTTIAVVKKESEPQAFTTFSFSLCAFGLASAVLIVIGRAGLGYDQMIDPHYITMTILTIIGGFLLFISIKNGYQKIKPFLYGGLVCLIIIGLILSIPRAIEAGNGVKKWWSINGYYLATYEIQSDENLANLYSDVKLVRDDAVILKQYNLSVFSEPALNPNNLALIAGDTPCSVDTINGVTPSQDTNYTVVINSQNETTLTITGWAIDQQAHQAAGGVLISVDGQKDIPAFYGLDRPDIAEFFKGSGYQLSGYSASFATSALERGQHTLFLKIIAANGKSYYQAGRIIILELK